MKKPQNLIENGYYLTDGGLETTLIFHYDIELRDFAAFELLNAPYGRKLLKQYFKPYLELAKMFDTGFILETPTWRSNRDWGQKLGYTNSELFDINKNSVQFLRNLVAENGNDESTIIYSGNIGPRGDGYAPDNYMTVTAAKDYHLEQIQALALGDADIVTGLTLNYIDEAVGIVEATKSLGVPVVISFTVETDGLLPSGESLSEAIYQVDKSTNDYVSYYMVNCAHPEHFKHLFQEDRSWKFRIKGVRANASCKSHQELDECTTLDVGNKHDLSKQYLAMKHLLPNLRIIGGCCGTDHSHLEEICQQLFMEEAKV